MDEKENITLTVKYPKLAGASEGTSGGGEGSSSYAVAVADGVSFQTALDRLRTIMPGEINLSALTIIVISEESLQEGKLTEVIEQLAVNYRMYSSAYFAVCEGNAGDFIKNQEPQIGSRLSEGLKTLIQNGQKLGSIPDSVLADLRYRMNSVYSDPLVMLCKTEKSGDKKENRYLGSCVVTDEGIAVKFDEKETKIVNLLMGKINEVVYTEENAAAIISLDRKPSIKVEIEEDVPVVTVNVKASVMRINGQLDVMEYKVKLEEDLKHIIYKCINAGTEPFGFADKAASRFITLEKWTEYDFQKHMDESNVYVNVDMTEIF